MLSACKMAFRSRRANRSVSGQDMPDALHFLVLTVAGWVNRPQDDQIAYLREEHRGLRASWPGGSVGPGACPCSAASARPVATCATIAGRPVLWASTRPAAHRQAVSGPRRPARGRTARPYAVVRRTRQRGGAVRGAAAPAVWGRRRAGTACACCARYSTSWSPASSSSCSLIML